MSAESSQKFSGPVLHLATERTWRGGEAQLLTLALGLAARGVRQLVVCPPGSELESRAKAAGLATHGLVMRGEWDLMAPRRLRKVAEELAPAICHAHTAHAHAILVRAFSKKNAPPRIVISRRVDFAVGRGLLSRRKYTRNDLHFLAISSGVRDALVKGGVSPERIRLVPSGVDPNKFSYCYDKSWLRRELGLGSDTPIIGNVGQLTDHKGHIFLIRAASRVIEARPRAHFVILGEGELRLSLEAEITRLGLAKQFHLLGFKKDVEPYLAGFDVFALSSHLEGLCTSLIDAMLLRVAAVGTKTGGVPDLITHEKTGLLVLPRDPESLARGILRLLDDPKLSESLAEAAHKHVCENFSADQMVEKTMDCYRKIVSA